MGKLRSLQLLFKRLGAGIGLVATFTTSLGLGVLLHLPLPPSRRLAAQTLITLVNREIRGRIEVQHFSRLDLAGLEAREVSIRAPNGDVVLHTPRLQARLNLLQILASAFSSPNEPILLRFSWARADHIDVLLNHDPVEKELSIATTFRLPPKPPKPPKPPSAEPSIPGRAVVVDLPAIEIGSVTATGNMSPLPAIDAQARQLRGSVYVGPDGLRIDTEQTPLIAQRILPSPIETTVDFHMRSPLVMWGKLLASAQDVTVSANAKLNDSYLDLSLDVPPGSSKALSALVPGLHLDDRTEAHLEAHGALPLVYTTVDARSGVATAQAHALFSLASAPHGQGFVQLRQANPAQFIAEAPSTQLNAEAQLTLQTADASLPWLRVQGSSASTQLYNQAIPPTQFDAQLRSSGVSGKVLVQEPGMPIDAHIEHSAQDGWKLTAHTVIPSLQAAPRLGKALSGQASATVDARYSHERLDANLTARLSGATRAGLKLGGAQIKAHTWGKPSALFLDAQVQGSQLAALGFQWQKANLSLHGPVRHPEVTVDLQDDFGPAIKAKASVAIGKTLLAQNLDIDVQRAAQHVHALAEQVSVSGGTVDFGAIAVDGLGEPIDGVVRVSPNGFDVRLISDAVELGKLSSLLGLAGHNFAGRARVDVDLKSVGAESTGCVRVDLKDGRFDFLDGLQGSMRAQFAGPHIDLDTNVSVGGTASEEPEPSQGESCGPIRAAGTSGIVDATLGANATLHGALLNPQSWTQATGTARLNQLTINLDKAGQVLGMLRSSLRDQKIPDFGGVIRAYGEVVRDTRAAPPAWSLALSSSGAWVDLGSAQEPKKIQGVDLVGSASMSKEGLLSTLLCVRDNQAGIRLGPCDPREESVLVTLGASARIDYDRLFHAPELWKELLPNTPVEARLSVLDRPLETLLRPVPLPQELPVQARQIGGWVTLRGSLNAPRLDYGLSLVDLSAANPSWQLPATVCALGSYDGHQGSMHAELYRPATSSGPNQLPLGSLCPNLQGLAMNTPPERKQLPYRRLGYVDGNLQLDWQRVLHPQQAKEPLWVANVNAIVHDFELGDIPALADNGLSGRVTLSGGVQGLGQEPQFGLRADMQQVRQGKGPVYEKGSLVARSDAQGASARLELFDSSQGADKSPRLSLQLETEQLRWTKGYEPQIDPEKPVDVRLQARDFPLAVLGPLFEPVLEHFDGEASGAANFSWSSVPGQSSIHDLFLTVRNGAFLIPTIGQEFVDVQAQIRASQPNQVQVEQFHARPLIGAVTGNATLDLNGLSVEQVTAAISVDPSTPMRLTLEGVPVGDLYGRVLATLERTAELNTVTVELDNVHVDLSSTDLRTVQSLAPNPEILVVPQVESSDSASKRYRQAHGTKDAPTPWKVTFHTLNPALVERTDMRFRVITPRSPAEALVLSYPDPPGSDELKLYGHLELLDGRINVLGKLFYVDESRARVNFDGPVSQPTLNVTARWEAPDGTRVFADVTGPLREPKIQFRSDPPKPARDVLAMVLVGAPSVDPTATAGTTANPSQATASSNVGGEVASAGINRLLEDLSPVTISTRIDTSQAQNVRPTLVLEVSRNVTAQATVNTGVIPLGQNPDRYQLTLDWRFLRKWTLRTTVGDAGSSIVDVFWQHRY